MAYKIENISGQPVEADRNVTVQKSGKDVVKKVRDLIPAHGELVVETEDETSEWAKVPNIVITETEEDV